MGYLAFLSTFLLVTTILYGEHLVLQVRRALYSHVLGGKEVTVVGDIPPGTARRIAESIAFVDSPIVSPTTEGTKP